jgi:GNAT superfamily N-acetyltransferase
MEKADLAATILSFSRFFTKFDGALDVAEILDRLTPYEQNDLAAALNTSRILLAGPEDRSFRLRTFRAGDMGRIASRQSLLYQAAFGWGSGIEVTEGEVTSAFLRNFKPGREQCWIAEIDGVMAGSIFLTDEGEGLSRLRLLYVEPFAQGRGIGNALVSECVAFARSVGYDAITLWTHSILESARRIYAAHGFHLESVEMHSTFGSPLQGETWRLQLRSRVEAVLQAAERG